MVLYGLKTCDTCRKALKSLPQAEFACVRGEGVPDIILERAFGQFGNALVNTRSATWRGLGEAERAQAPLVLIKSHPTLMKRPLIDDGTQLHLGWTSGVQKSLGVA